MSRSVQALPSPVILSPRPARLGLLASACSPRPARLGLLASACFLLILTLVSLPITSAQAYPGGSYPGNTPVGSWQITYAQDGAWSDDIRDNPTLGQMTPEGAKLPAYTTGESASGGGADNKINGSVTDTVTATLTWVHPVGLNDTTDPAPKKVYLREYGYAWYGSINDNPATGTADDGLGDPAGTNGDPNESSGCHLLVRDGSSGSITLAPVTLKAINPVSSWTTYYPGSNYGSWTFTGCEYTVNYSVVVDADPNPRSVTITSFGTKHKDSVTGLAVPDVPDPDGTFEMTSIYSYHNWTLAGETLVDSPFINWITFSPHYIGNWHWRSGYDHNGNVVTAPDVIFPDTWVWSPNESEDNWDYGKVSMGFGQIEYQDGGPEGSLTGNQTYHVSLSATDHTDNATAVAHANIALHDEWENKQNASPATTFHSQRTYAVVTGTKVGVSNNTQTKYTSPPTWTATINGSVTMGVKFGSTFDVAWAKMFGIEVNAAATVGGSIAISVPGPLLDPGFWTFPFVLTTWNTNNYLVDHYTVTGFEATYPQSADDPNSVTETGSWSDPQLIGQSPPP